MKQEQTTKLKQYEHMQTDLSTTKTMFGGLQKQLDLTKQQHEQAIEENKQLKIWN